MWSNRGRGPDATAEESAFAEALDRAVDGVREADAAPSEVTDDDLIEVLAEAATKRGNATAAGRLLTERRRGRERAVEEVEAEQPISDPFVYLEPDSMAKLNEEQKQQARVAHVASCDAHPPPWLSAEEWAWQRAEILAGRFDVLPAEPRHRRSEDER